MTWEDLKTTYQQESSSIRSKEQKKSRWKEVNHEMQSENLNMEEKLNTVRGTDK